MLYKPEQFETLTETDWREDDVRDRIRKVVADTEAAFSPHTLWPAHEWDVWGSQPPVLGLYAGAAGVVWALDRLREHGVTLDLAGTAARVAERWHERPDFADGLDDLELPEPADGALFTGGTGVLLVAYKLAPSARLADELHELVLANVDNRAVEVMWGPLGTLLAARTLHEWSGEERWADAWRRTAEAVLAKRNDEGLWPTRLWGNDYVGLTPPHGLVGNVDALCRGDFLDAETRERLTRDANAALARAAVLEDGAANWPQPWGGPLEREDGLIPVQWCAGAPGIVIGASSYLDEELLLAGAELTYRAGASNDEKGAGLCHGTAGNGYALLKTFERTQDERWLDRARRFAVHALEQAERRPRRHSLFTGDLGVALFAADCLDARARFPLTDEL